MPIQKTNITDAELISKIATSKLEEGQKSELTNLAKEMTSEERGELIALIKEANESAEMTKEEEEKLIAINEKYEKKLAVAAKEESTYVRTEFEKFDKEQDQGEFKKLETEIQEMPSSNGSNPPLSKSMNRPNVIQNEKHTIRNIILITFALIVVIATLIVLISIV